MNQENRFADAIVFLGAPSAQALRLLGPATAGLPILILSEQDPQIAGAEHVHPAGGDTRTLRDRVSAFLQHHHRLRPLYWLSDPAHVDLLMVGARGLLVAQVSESFLEKWVSRSGPQPVFDVAVADQANLLEAFRTAGGLASHQADMTNPDGVMQQITHAQSQRAGERLRVLVLYEARSTFTATVREYLDAFRRFSRHDIWFAVGTSGAPLRYDLNHFDVVLLHYSVRICIDWYISKEYAEALQTFSGLKMVIIQDEYEDTDTTRASIRKLGLHVVFNNVPPEQLENFYPRAAFPNTRFVQVLTGYVPEAYEHRQNTPDTADRPILIGYRGRPLPYWYGELGQEKIGIGKRMLEICLAKGLKVDIAWGNEDRIYGNAWYDFVRSCRVMLGSETGSNVFDDRGDIRKGITQALAFIPDLTFEEAKKLFIGDREKGVHMNQISPKIFEAVAFRTGLVLFEGTYSGILIPDLHYISLKKDFSNVDDVLAKVQNVEFVRAMTERAYEDVIAKGNYGYPEFIRKVDRVIDGYNLYSGRTAFQFVAEKGKEMYAPTREILDDRTSNELPPHAVAQWRPTLVKTVLRQATKRAWLLLPRQIRLRIYPLLLGARERLLE